MTEERQARQANLVERLKEARAKRHDVKKRLVRELTKRRMKQANAGTYHDIAKLIRSYGNAVAGISDIEAEIDEQFRCNPGLVTGNTIDFERARAEVLARITRVRAG